MSSREARVAQRRSLSTEVPRVNLILTQQTESKRSNNSEGHSQLQSNNLDASRRSKGSVGSGVVPLDTMMEQQDGSGGNNNDGSWRSGNSKGSRRSDTNNGNNNNMNNNNTNNNDGSWRSGNSKGSGRSGNSKSSGAKEALPPGQSTDQRSSSANTAGPFVTPKNPFADDNDSTSDNSDNDANNEGGQLTPQDIEEWHSASNSKGTNSMGGGDSLQDFTGDGSLASIEEGKQSGNNSVNSRGSKGSFGAGKNNLGNLNTTRRSGSQGSSTRPQDMVNSAFTANTTSSDDTRPISNVNNNNNNANNNAMNDNQGGDGNEDGSTPKKPIKPYYNLSKPEERQNFMAIMSGNQGDIPGAAGGDANNVNDGGTNNNNGNNDDFVPAATLPSSAPPIIDESPEARAARESMLQKQWSMGEGNLTNQNNNNASQSPLFPEDGGGDSRPPTYRPRNGAIVEEYGDDESRRGSKESIGIGSSFSKPNMNEGGEHYASMQELLDDENNNRFDDENKRNRSRMDKVCGPKQSRRRKITLLAFICCIFIAIIVAMVVVFLLQDKSGEEDKTGVKNTPNTPYGKEDLPSRPPGSGPGAPTSNGGGGGSQIGLTFKVPTLSPSPTTSPFPTDSPTKSPITYLDSLLQELDGKGIAGGSVPPTSSPVGAATIIDTDINADSSNLDGAIQKDDNINDQVSWPNDNPPYDTQPTFSSTNGKLEVTLHLGVSGTNFNNTPNFISESMGFEGNIIGYFGCVHDTTTTNDGIVYDNMEALSKRCDEQPAASSGGRRMDEVGIRMGGPTLRVTPGDELIIHLYNDMPQETCKTTENIGFWNDFHQPMNTNIHVHGLFVPNSENNVFESIYPGEMLTYNIKIREVQQGGTHWYHPHAEGAVGLQAGGGAIGLLIVEDLDGDIPPEIASLPEINMRIQHTNWKYQNEQYATDYVNKCKEVCSSSDEAMAQCGCSDPETECSEPVFGVPAYVGNYSEALTVNGAENPSFDIFVGQWYHIRSVYVPTYKVPIEPTINGCDFKLLSKDGRYMPVTPRDIQAGYMFSGSRADFLIRCNSPGSYPFESIDTVPRPHNWATWDGESNSLLDDQRHEGSYGQKLDAWKGTMATFNVVVHPPDHMQPELDEIRPFRVARPCYAPEMRNVTIDDNYYFLQSALNPPAPEGETYPVFRHQPSTGWNASLHGNFFSINELNETDTAYPGRLKPPKGSPACDGKITNEFGECYGPPPPGQDFTFNIGDIVEIDYHAPQIHPLHGHVFGFQITQLPKFSPNWNDYFQVGDYHDNLLVPIAGDDNETQAEAPEYGKVVFRQHIYKLSTDIVVHCHFYRHSDRGMIALGNTQGTEGSSNPDVEGTCYHGLSGRQFTYELSQDPSLGNETGGVGDDFDKNVSSNVTNATEIGASTMPPTSSSMTSASSYPSSAPTSSMAPSTFTVGVSEQLDPMSAEPRLSGECPAVNVDAPPSTTPPVDSTDPGNLDEISDVGDLGGSDLEASDEDTAVVGISFQIPGATPAPTPEPNTIMVAKEVEILYEYTIVIDTPGSSSSNTTNATNDFANDSDVNGTSSAIEGDQGAYDDRANEIESLIRQLENVLQSSLISDRCGDTNGDSTSIEAVDSSAADDASPPDIVVRNRLRHSVSASGDTRRRHLRGLQDTATQTANIQYKGFNSNPPDRMSNFPCPEEVLTSLTQGQACYLIQGGMTAVILVETDSVEDSTNGTIANTTVGGVVVGDVSIEVAIDADVEKAIKNETGSFVERIFTNPVSSGGNINASEPSGGENGGVTIEPLSFFTLLDTFRPTSQPTSAAPSMSPKPSLLSNVTVDANNTTSNQTADDGMNSWPTPYPTVSAMPTVSSGPSSRPSSSSMPTTTSMPASNSSSGDGFNTSMPTVSSRPSSRPSSSSMPTTTSMPTTNSSSGSGLNDTANGTWPTDWSNITDIVGISANNTGSWNDTSSWNATNETNTSWPTDVSNTTDIVVITANGTDTSNVTTYPPTDENNDGTGVMGNGDNGLNVTNSTVPGTDPTVSDTNTVGNSSVAIDLTAALNLLSAPYVMSHSMDSNIWRSQFGFSVASATVDEMDQQMVVAVGAKDATNEMGVPTGAVYLYSLTPASTSMELLQTLYGSSSNSEFGNSLKFSRNGRRLVIGARGENGDTGAKNTGAMHIYQHQDGASTWTLDELIPGQSQTVPGRAGWEVSISGDGNVVAMGAPVDGPNNEGAVFIYKYDDSTSQWTQYGSIIRGGTSEAAGYSVSLSETGEAVLIGYPKATNPNPMPDGLKNAGKGEAFTIAETVNGTIWTQVGQTIYGEGENVLAGAAAAMSNDAKVIVIGSKNHHAVNAAGEELKSAGQCRIYKLESNQWVYEKSMIGIHAKGKLGTSVGVSSDGNVIACGGVVGVRNEIASGVVRLWNRLTAQESTIWPRAGAAGNAAEGANFGNSLAVSNNGNYVVVGAPSWKPNAGGESAGAIQVFQGTV